MCARMRLSAGVRSVAAVAVAALLLGACGDDTTAETHAPEQLGTALLAASDLGEGWTEEEREVVTTTVPESTPEADDLGLCPEAKDVATSVPARARVVLSSPTATEQQAVGVIEELWSGDDVSAQLAAVRAGTKACLGKQWTVEGDTVTVEELPDAPDAGDESVSFLGLAGEAPSGELEWYMPTTYARVGNDLVRITYLEIHPADTPRTVTSEEFARVVDAAVAKVESLES